MQDPNRMMDYFMLALGVYILYAGITGKGNMMYRDETIHRSQKEKYYKMMRLFGLTAGPLSVLGSILTINNLQLAGNIVSIVFFAVLVFVIVQIARMTDKHIKKSCAKRGIPEPPSDGFAEARAAKTKSAGARTASPDTTTNETAASIDSHNQDGDPNTPHTEKRTVDQDDIRFF